MICLLSLPLIRGHSCLLANLQETHSSCLLSTAAASQTPEEPKDTSILGAWDTLRRPTPCPRLPGWVTPKPWVGPTQPHYLQHDTSPTHRLREKSRDPTTAEVNWPGVKPGPGHSPALVNRQHASQAPKPLLTSYCPLFSANAPPGPSPTCPNFPFYTTIAQDKRNCRGKNKTIHVYIYLD